MAETTPRPDPWDSLPEEVTDAIRDYRRAIEDEAGAYEHGHTHLGQSSEDARDAMAAAIARALASERQRADEAARIAETLVDEKMDMAAIIVQEARVRELERERDENEQAHLAEELRALKENAALKAAGDAAREALRAMVASFGHDCGKGADCTLLTTEQGDALRAATRALSAPRGKDTQS